MDTFFLTKSKMKAGDILKKMIKLSFFICYIMLVAGSIAYAGDSVAQINSSVNKIVDAVAYFGYAIAFIMLIYVGIKYAMSPANEKADVKQGTINYLIGAFLIICASTVANIFVEVAASGETSNATLADKIISAAQSAAGVAGAPEGDGDGT